MFSKKVASSASIAIIALLLLTVLQSAAVAQLELPYVVRSALVLAGGAALGLVASLIWIHWLEKNYRYAD